MSKRAAGVFRALSLHLSADPLPTTGMHSIMQFRNRGSFMDFFVNYSGWYAVVVCLYNRKEDLTMHVFAPSYDVGNQLSSIDLLHLVASRCFKNIFACVSNSESLDGLWMCMSFYVWKWLKKWLSPESNCWYMECRTKSSFFSGHCALQYRKLLSFYTYAVLGVIKR